jgi:hypothetical protein
MTPRFRSAVWTVVYVVRRDLEVKAMQKAMQSRRKEHANHGDERHAAKQGV